MSDDILDLLKQADPILKAIWPTISAALRDKPSPLQGAVLADLTAVWLAGHIGRDAEATDKLRMELLDLHVRAIQELVFANERSR
jgi:hypothetical protein